MITLSLCNATVRKRLHAGLTVASVALAVALASVPASLVSAETYYVDNQHPNSSAAGPGTEAAPYYTITSAITAHKGPGVTIIVKPGIYREQVAVLASGASGSPFIIRAQGPGVVVDAADNFSNQAQWIQPAPAPVSGPHGLVVTDHAWLAPAVSWSPRQVFVNGRRLTPSSAAPADLPLDAFTWVQGQGLYVNLGGVNPGRHEVLVGRRAAAFRLGGRSWVTIEGFEISRAEDAGINLFFGCSDVVVARNRIALSNSYGIKVSGGSRVLLEENATFDGGFHGIGLTDGSYDCVLRGNESYRNAQRDVRTAKGIFIAGAPNNVLVGNRTYQNQDSGIQLNPGSHSCVLVNNRSWDNGDHGYDHLDASGTTHLNNVAHGNHNDGFSIEGNSPNTTLYNCIATENGLTTGRFNLWVNSASAIGFSSGYNIIWNSTDQEPVKFMSTKYSLLSDYNAASGQDFNSLQEDPLFADAATGDFMPLSGSPAIDAGYSGADHWPSSDLLGNPRYDDPSIPNSGSGPVAFADIGPYEFVPAAAAGAAELPSPLPVSGDRRVSLHDGLAGAGAGRLAMSSAFPNPSSGPVEFALDLPRDSRIEWVVYDLQGRAVWSEGRAVTAGRVQLRWDGTGTTGAPAATGVYLVRALVDGAQFTRRIIRF